MRSFDEATTWEASGPGAWTGTVDPDWMQGRATFGGVVAGLALRCMRSCVAPDRAPRSLHTSFVGPLGAGPATLTVEVLRAGGSLTHVEARLVEDGSLRAVFLGAFGADRDSVVDVPGSLDAALPPFASLRRFPPVDGVHPVFLRHFDMRFAEGSPPFSGAAEAGFGGWCRHLTAATGHEAVLALLDAWPAPVLRMLSRPAPASSVTWTAHLLDLDGVDLAGPFWYRSDPVQAGRGYTGTRARLYTPEGRLVGHMDQLVAVFG